MITKFTIKNFRGLENVTLTNLKRVNLIGGKNGSGKTSVLEALWVFASPTRPDVGYRINDFRGVSAFSDSSVFRDLFFAMDIDREISLVGRGDWGTQNRELTISLRERAGQVEPLGVELASNGTRRENLPRALGSLEMVFDYQSEDGRTYQTYAVVAEETAFLPIVGAAKSTGIIVQPDHGVPHAHTSFLQPKLKARQENLAAKFGEHQLDGRQNEVIDFLKAVGPDVKDLVPIQLGDQVVLHASIQGYDRLMPINMVGEGGFKALEIAISISSARNGMVLIDEIENSLYYSTLKGVFQRIYDLADEYNVQVFATTHSLECLKAAYTALGSNKMSYTRIGSHENRARAVNFDAEMLRVAFELPMEIR